MNDEVVTPEIICTTVAMVIASARVEPADLTMDESRPRYVTVDRTWLALLALEFEELKPGLLDEVRNELARIERGEPLTAGVYFVRSGDAVKIGMSKDIPGRLRALRTMSPLPLELLGVIPGGRDEESELHRTWAAHRLHGEWFTAAPELLEHIAVAAHQAGQEAQ